MNGFLVIGRGMADDIPMRLCATREEAEEFARTLNKNDVNAEAEDLFEVTVETLIGAVIVEFREGAPIAATSVRNWDDKTL